MATTTPGVSLSWATQIHILFAHTCAAPHLWRSHTRETLNVLSELRPPQCESPSRPPSSRDHDDPELIVACLPSNVRRTMLSLSPRPSFTFRRLPSVFQDWPELHIALHTKSSLELYIIYRISARASERERERESVQFSVFRCDPTDEFINVCEKQTRVIRAKLKVRLNCIKFITHSSERLCYSTLLKYDENQKIANCPSLPFPGA